MSSPHEHEPPTRDETAGITCVPVTGMGEVRRGDDLAALLAGTFTFRDGDVVVVTSKVVSKAEGRVVPADPAATLAAETDRTVARRGQTSIVRTHHGLVMAAAGIDASNTEPGSSVLLPRDPDASARGLRERLASLTGANVAVVVTDTAGRAWRTGQTDLAIGVAGLSPSHDYAGTPDGYGNVLEVTEPAVADEIAGAADLVKGKLGRRPAAVLRGLPALVLPAAEHGPGARALVRPEAQDMFGYGAREAVVAAVERSPGDARGFGAPVPAPVLAGVLDSHAAAAAPVGAVTVSQHSEHAGDPEQVEVRLDHGDPRWLAGVEETLATLAYAHGWLLADHASAGPGTDVVLRFRPTTP